MSALFELSFIKKYLTPSRKQLSVSLIALLSIGVITLVVWLVVLFLSVTEGIERNWLQKLTALNAPIRLQPTPEYFQSYYYTVDKYSADSNYMSKTLGQKAHALLSDPYNPEMDESLPKWVAQPDRDQSGQLKDPVKGVMEILQELNGSYKGFAFQDIESSGALLRLNLIRQDPSALEPYEMQSQLTNVSYLATFPEKNPSLKELLLPPSEEDLNHLLLLGKHAEPQVASALKNAWISQLKTKKDFWQLPFELLPEKESFEAVAYSYQDSISHLILPVAGAEKASMTLERRGNRLFYKAQNASEIPLDPETPLFIHGSMEFEVEELEGLEGGKVRAQLQQKSLIGSVSLEGLEVVKASLRAHFKEAPKTIPPWPYSHEGKLFLPESGEKSGIVLSKHFRDHGVHLGDSGYLAYSSTGFSGTKEIHLPTLQNRPR